MGALIVGKEGGKGTSVVSTEASTIVECWSLLLVI